MDEKEEKDIWQRLTACEASLKSMHHRIDRIDELTQSIQTVVVEIKHIREDVTDVKSDVSAVNDKVAAIEAKPAKRWEALIAALISAIVGGVGGYILSALMGGG